MATLWTVLTLLAGLHAADRAPLAAGGAVLDLPAMVQRAPIIVLARVADPRMDVQNLPMGKSHLPFQRMRRHLDVLSVLRGRAPQHLRVDDSRWTAQRLAQQQCRQAERCAPPPLDRYRGQLSREPNPGQIVIAFLRAAGHGEFELAADFALDRGEREQEVRALLPAKQEGGRR